MRAQCGKSSSQTLSVVCSIDIFVLHYLNLMLCFDTEINNFVTIYHIQQLLVEQSPYCMQGSNLKLNETIKTPRQ